MFPGKRKIVAGVLLPCLLLGSGTAADAGASRSDSRAPSGERMPVGDLAGWKQVFRDDFRQAVPVGGFPAAVSEAWSAYPDGWRDTSGNGRYWPSRVVSIAGGVMTIRVHNDGRRNLVAAPTPHVLGPGRQGGMVYGRYAVRFRADPVPGFKIAWLLWPDTEKWPDGEIDFPEGNLDGNVWAFNHHVGRPTAQDAFDSRRRFSDWHTAVIEWRPERIRFLLDRVEIGSVTNRAVIPRTPMHWVLQTETATHPARPRPGAQARVQIDWVAAYRLATPRKG